MKKGVLCCVTLGPTNSALDVSSWIFFLLILMFFYHRHLFLFVNHKNPHLIKEHSNNYLFTKKTQ